MKENQGLNSVDFCVVVLFSAYYLLPAISARFNETMVLAMVMCYIALCCFLNGMKLAKETLKYILLVVMISIMYVLLTDTKTIAMDASNRGMKRFLSKVFQLGCTFLPVLFSKRFLLRASRRQKRILLCCNAVMIAYVVSNTTLALMTNPNITRSWSGFSEAAESNIGSYALVYAVPFLIVLCVLSYFNLRKSLARLAIILLILFQFYFLLLAQYTLAVLITVCGIVFTIYRNTSKSRMKILLLLAVVCVIPLVPLLLKYAAAHVPSEQMSIRLYEIYYFLVGTDIMGYNMSGRMELYVESVKAFLRSPIIGNRSLDFDGHATFLTVPADLGLLGGVPYYYLYFHSYKKIQKILHLTVDNYKTFFVMLMMMGFTNPIHAAYTLMYVVWFMVPLVLQMREDNLNGARTAELGN